MKLLSFSNDGNLFGAQRSLLTLLAGLVNENHHAGLVIPQEGPLIEAASAAGVEAIYCPYPHPSRRPLRALGFFATYPFAAGRLRQLVHAWQPDVIHYNTSSCLAPSLALKKLPIPKIHHLRERAPALGFTSRIIAAGCDAVVANCQYVADFYPLLQERHGIQVVYNGLDVQQPSQERAQAAASEFGLDPAKPLVVFAGQLRPHKDPWAVLTAANFLRDKGVDAQFLILGSGPLEQELRASIDKENLADRVFMPGYVDDILPYLAAAEVVMIPSLIEPFPRAGLEAMALGKAIVSTTAGGIPEQLIHGDSALLSEPGDHISMSNDIHSLLSGQPAMDFGDSARGRYRQYFSAQAYLNGFIKVLQSLESGN